MEYSFHRALRLGLLSAALAPVALAQITIGAVTNGASFAANSLSPGSIATIFGTNLATSTGAGAASIPLPKTLGGASVTVNGIRAPLFYAGSADSGAHGGQINFQIPYGIPVGTASVVVTVGSAKSATFTALTQTASPGIFQFGTNRAVAQNPDGSLNNSNNPVAAGSYIVAYLTGIGPVDHPVQDGAATPQQPLSRATSPYSATIGGQNANVFFLGLTPGFVGLAQANITVPSLPNGTYPLVITVDGAPSNALLVTVSGAPPTTPQLSLLSTVAAPIAPRNVAINGTTAYLCGSQAIDVVDVSDPANPAVLSTIGQADLNNSGIYCALLGKNLIDLINTQSLVVYSVTEPTHPERVSQFQPAWPFAGYMFFSGMTVFFTTDWFNYNTGSNTISAQHGEFFDYDFSNPSLPTYLSYLQPNASQPASSDASPRFAGVALDNQTALVTATTSTGSDPSGGSAQVQVIDISNLISMQAAGQVLIPQAAVATAIATQGNLALVAGNTTSWRNPGIPNFDFTGALTLTALDITDPRNPSVLSTLVTEVATSFDAGPILSSLGNGFFALAIPPPADETSGNPTGNGQLAVVDATDTQSLKLVTLDSAAGLSGIAVSGSNLYAATANGLSVYQITNPK